MPNPPWPNTPSTVYRPMSLVPFRRQYKFSSEVKGIVELSRELGRSFEDTVAYVSKKFDVPDEIIQQKVSSFWN